MGTGNDLARSLGLSREPVAAAQAVVAADERQLDCGVASGAGVERLFVNACVGGFPVAVDEALDARTKDLLGSLAFWIGGVKALPHLERANVTVNGKLVGDCVVVGVGNGRTVGGGFPLFPNATVDDGQLDACALAIDDLASAVRVLARVRSGSHSGLDEVVEERAPRIEIAADRPIEFNVDGELLGLTTPAVFERVGTLLMRAAPN